MRDCQICHLVYQFITFLLVHQYLILSEVIKNISALCSHSIRFPPTIHLPTVASNSETAESAGKTYSQVSQTGPGEVPHCWQPVSIRYSFDVLAHYQCSV